MPATPEIIPANNKILNPFIIIANSYKDLNFLFSINISLYQLIQFGPTEFKVYTYA